MLIKEIDTIETSQINENNVDLIPVVLEAQLQIIENRASTGSATGR